VIALVVALSENRVIGRDGGLPWRLSTDMKHFRELTTGHAVVMGRRTYESIPPRFRPLPERRNLVLSTNPAYEADGAEVFGDLMSALGACGSDCFVIGGGVTYDEALPLAERVHATHVEGEIVGDTYFPELPPDAWRIAEESARVHENGHTFRFVTYDRVR
jgi:dihydrofolate reductase